MTCWKDVIIDYDCDDEEDEEECYCEEESESSENLLSPFVPFETYYHIAIGDVLEISVFGDEETTVEHVVVAPDGRIYYTFVEGIYADGKMIREVSEELESKLTKLFNNPIVTIVLKETESHTYKILGRVQRPGLYNVLGPVRLREALSIAGGLQTESYKDKTTPLQQIANLRESFIVRKNQKLNVDFEKLYYEPDVEQNIYVHPGDYIYVAGYETRKVYVLGAVRAPLAIPWTSDITLMGAISIAGAWPIGNAYSPDIKKTLLLRGSLDNPLVIHLDLRKILDGEAKDFYLQPGDIVFLPEKGFRYVRELIRLAINTFIQSFGSAAGSYYGELVLFPVGPGSSSSDSTSAGE